MSLSFFGNPAFVDRLGLIVVGTVFLLIAARLVLPSSFQRNVRNVVHHPFQNWFSQ